MFSTDLCSECGFSHHQERRLSTMRRLLPCSLEELRNSHPCWWGGPTRSKGERQLYRDLEYLGARKAKGSDTWAIQHETRREAA